MRAKKNETQIQIELSDRIEYAFGGESHPISLNFTRLSVAFRGEFNLSAGSLSRRGGPRRDFDNPHLGDPATRNVAGEIAAAERLYF